MRTIALGKPVVSQKARFMPRPDGGGRVITPAAPWHEAVAFPVDGNKAASVFALVDGCRGEVDIMLFAEDRTTPTSHGTRVAAGETRVFSAALAPDGARARWLTIRNAGRAGVSECEVRAVLTGDVPTVDLTAAEAVLALRDPSAARESCVRRTWQHETISLVGAASLPLRVRPPRTPFDVPPRKTLWSGAMETIVLGAAEDLVRLLDGFRGDALESYVALLPDDSMRSYLYMNVVRVVRLVELLRRRGSEGGTVLEVGAWFGSFALALQRLGYDVVACDRYESYGGAFDRNVALLRDEGVEVVSTARDAELDQISALGHFDAVLATAVIEHVPHTPRLLLETLFGVTRPGGLLLLDTPNVARYWNRHRLAQGETIFQPLADQYWTDLPWEGHHREYTGAELEWMFEQAGCEAVEVEFFDYNMLQFDELSAEHTQCLATIVEDPSQSDLLLAAGRRPTANL